MSKIENDYLSCSYKQWGSKCGCVEFTFDNIGWFTSRTKLVVTFLTFLSLVLSYILFQDIKLQYFFVPVLVLVFIFIVGNLLICVRKETLYVIPPVGVQFITTYVVGKESVLFIPWHSVKSFVIVEMVVGQKIFFYLGLQNSTNVSNGLVILFQNTRPRLSHLEDIYRVIVKHSFS